MSKFSPFRYSSVSSAADHKMVLSPVYQHPGNMIQFLAEKTDKKWKMPVWPLVVIDGHVKSNPSLEIDALTIITVH